MTKTEKILLSLSITLTMFAIGFFYIQSAMRVEGSVSQGSEYISTTTRAVTNGGTFAATAITSPQLLTLTSTSTNGTLGSVIITGTGQGITIYDGTTTLNHSDSSTTTLASFSGSTAAGTYTFDLRFYKGLILETTGTGTSTITWRQN